MRQMIDASCRRTAAASGARIVFSCGFDSIPFDLGVLFLQDQMHCSASARRCSGCVAACSKHEAARCRAAPQPA
jgi:short subunit dehydrogenase-like uncharacterized protein